MLGQCSLRHRFPVCSSGGNSNRKSSFWRLVGICVFPCRTGTSRSCSPSEVCTPITSRFGVGSSGMPQKWNDVCALGSDRPPTVGEWTKPTSGSRASGSIYTGLSTPAVRRSTSFCRLTRRSSGRALSRQGFGRREPSGAAGHQHRRARRLSTGDRAAQSRGGSEGELPASTGAISQQRSGTGSSGYQAPDTRKPAFSLVLGSLAHDRRLRSDPYDPQRPGVRKRSGGEGRSTPLLHSSFVQRGDRLILRALSPNFALTPKLQHYPMKCQGARRLACPQLPFSVRSMPQPGRQVRHSKRFLLTPNRARHPLRVSLRTFDQRRSLWPGAGVTGDSEKSRSRSLGDKPSYPPGGNNENTLSSCPCRIGNL